MNYVVHQPPTNGQQNPQNILTHVPHCLERILRGLFTIWTNMRGRVWMRAARGASSFWSTMQPAKNFGNLSTRSLKLDSDHLTHLAGEGSMAPMTMSNRRERGNSVWLKGRPLEPGAERKEEKGER